MPHSKLDAPEIARSRELTGLGKIFGDLKVRPKLMILHNIFFLVLTCAVYFALIPPYEKQVADAASRELSLVMQRFAADKPLLNAPGMEVYRFEQGTASQLRIPPEIRRWLDANPGAVWQGAAGAKYIYLKDPNTGLYRKLRTPRAFYESMVGRPRWTLLAVLAAVYALAVLLLELVIMPKYVYRPLRLMLEADSAARRGDKKRELIGAHLIPGDEIGQIMRSRNATVAQLTKKEQDLARALARLGETAADLRRKNNLLETAKQNLADQDRLVSLGMLSAGIAHELNTPLAVLSGSIEKLIETVDDPAAQERLGRMLRVSHRLRKISEGLLDFARAPKQEMEPVVVRRVIEEAWDLVAIDEKARGVRFTNEARPDDLVIGNPDRLVQVFVNLLRNALSAVKYSGVIAVTSSRVAVGARSWIEIAIEDNGPGIPPDVLPHIFEAFVTSRLDARGTGLGLAVAESIIQQHGGTIAAGNRPGGGARLELRLPAATPQEAA
ncbi:MAG: HAMP domain-containing histidine kinase [Acidobacteria bacterium]|nr:HAMP domain-containing histidine kinase [Acidobacteriota bacterium]